MIQSSESFADVLCSTILEDNVSNVHVCTCNRTYEHVEKEQIRKTVQSRGRRHGIVKTALTMH